MRAGVEEMWKVGWGAFARSFLANVAQTDASLWLTFNKGARAGRLLTPVAAGPL